MGKDPLNSLIVCVTKRRDIRLRARAQKKAAAGELIEVEFIDFKAIKEDWSSWELGDGTRIRVRATLDEAYIPRDPETKDIMRGEGGAPKYGFGLGFKFVVEPSESAVLKEED